MPHLKVTEKPFEAVSRVLKGYGVNQTILAEKLECNPRTAKKKIDDPSLLTLDDIKKLSQRAHIPIEEIRGAIKW